MSSKLHTVILKTATTASKRVMEKAVVELLERKANEQGAKLSARQRALLLKSVRARRFGRIVLPGNDRKISIQITDADVSQIRELGDKLLTRLPEIVESEGDALADHVATKLRAKWPVQERMQASEKRSFEDRLLLRWQRPLDTLGMLITCARELPVLLEVADASRPYLNEVLLRLHARACQVAYEVLVLLKAGLADGAMARWRTIHEIAVTASYIYEHGEAMAKRYLDHAAVETDRAIQVWDTANPVLGYKPIGIRLRRTVAKAKAMAIKRYGPGFKGHYGWAGLSPDQEINSFTWVEEKATLAHWRPFYKSASYNTHANAHGITRRLGLYKSNLLLAGPSNFGLAEPGQSTAISLSIISSTLMVSRPMTFDAVVTLKVINRLTTQAGREFVAVQRQIEREEDKRRDSIRRRKLRAAKKSDSKA